tara:strand:- start:193 stop:978 length:786 start_codon:yes stop_codon:yes gene_type:complete
MFIFYLLVFFAALPIIAYLLGQKTDNKGIILGYSILILSFCLIAFVSKFALFGSLNKQILTNKIIEEIYIDSKVPQEHLKEIESILDSKEIQVWMISLISKSINIDKLNAAESLIAFSEKFFVTNNEKIIFYGLYTNLRDAKFPEFKDSNFQIHQSSEVPCRVDTGNIQFFIMNGPEIPIAKKEFEDIENIFITNSDSIIPGFDLASANLNNEEIEFEINLTCKESIEEFYIRNFIVLNQNTISYSYKIGLNEWLKKSQEL